MDKWTSLNNGVKIPILGIGTDVIKGDDVIFSVTKAIENGYRLIDTASLYRNEKEVGIAIKNCIDRGIVKREDLFISTKAPYFFPGEVNTIQGIEESLTNLQLDYVDLYLLHHVYMYTDYQRVIPETWRAMEQIYEMGKARSIGVCNYFGQFCDVLYNSAKIFPHINQFEYHPQHQNKEILEWCRKYNTQPMSWGTLNQGRLFNSQVMEEIAQKHNKSIAQVAIRWNLQKGHVALVRSTKEERLKSNYDVWDFKLSEEEMNVIDNLDGKGQWSNIHGADSIPIGTIPNRAFFQYFDEKMKQKEENSVSKYKLFGFIPFLTKLTNGNLTKWYLFGIKILKIYKK